MIVEYQVPQENRVAFDAQLRQNVAETLRDEGCLRMEILQHATDAGYVVLHELWADETWVEKHRQRPGHDDGHTAIDRLLHGKRVNRYTLE
jgi:quinol monooxygenase YgiN